MNLLLLLLLVVVVVVVVLIIINNGLLNDVPTNENDGHSSLGLKRPPDLYSTGGKNQNFILTHQV